MTRSLLRAIAVAIGIAAVVDPAITMSGAARARLAIVAQSSAPPGADRVRAELVQRLHTSYEIVPHVTSDAAAAIVIGDRYPDSDVVFSGTVATVTMGAAPSPGIRIVRVDAPRAVPAATSIRVGVEVDGQGVSGRTTDVTVRIAGLEVGRASHRWTRISTLARRDRRGTARRAAVSAAGRAWDAGDNGRPERYGRRARRCTARSASRRVLRRAAVVGLDVRAPRARVRRAVPGRDARLHFARCCGADARRRAVE